MKGIRNSLLCTGLILVVSICLLKVECIYSRHHQLPPSHKESGLHYASVGLDDVEGRIGCFGDFNNDRFNDIFILSGDGRSITLYMWDTNCGKFVLGLVHLPFEGSDTVVENLEAADFDHDGCLDLLVQGRTGSSPLVVLKVLYGNHVNIVRSIDLKPSHSVQVTIFDYNGDSLPDLLGNAEFDGAVLRAVWVGPFFSDHAPIAWNVGLPFSNPHSNAVVDMDGDCAADLVLTTITHYEVYLWNGSRGRFEDERKLAIDRLPGLEGQATFADVDGDGNIDLVIPVCEDGECHDGRIYILYNRQKRVCSDDLDEGCRSASSLCTADPNFEFVSRSDPRFGESTVVVAVGPMGRSGVHLHVRFNDFNLDMYPDLLIPVIVNGARKMTLWVNVECDVASCGEKLTSERRRTFKKYTEGVRELEDIEGAVSGVWFDLYESASNDILVMTETNGRNGIVSLVNNYFNDAYFLKLFGVNGPCPKFYGVNQHGLTFKFTFTNLTANRMVSSAPQLFQSSYNSLQTPYVISGVGRPNNYIEYIFMGIGAGRPGNSRSWSGIIPNSQLVIFSCPTDSPSEWNLEMYVIPSTWLYVVTIIYTLLIMLSLVVVVILQMRENKEDERELKEKEHLYSFRSFY